MASFKQNKIKFGFLETATSGGTLTLTSSSKQYQILTGSSNHSVVLPNATTLIAGIAFTVINSSTGIVTVYHNDTSTVLATLPAGSGIQVLLDDASTSNGSWSKKQGTTGGAGGLGASAPVAPKTSNYSIVSGDNGKIITVNTAGGSVSVTLPAPVAGFKVTIKDVGGQANLNNISVLRNGSEMIDGSNADDVINEDWTAVSYISDGTNWFRMDSFRRGVISMSGRALFGGGDNGSNLNTIDYVEIATTGNATDFGDLSVTRNAVNAVSSMTRAVWGGGSTGTQSNVMDYVDIATTGNATDFGDLTVARFSHASYSNSIRGLWVGGNDNSVSHNTIDYITIAVIGNATDFGDLTALRSSNCGFASATRGVSAAGQDPGNSNVIEYVTIATLGNAIDFGDLTVARRYPAGFSSATRGLICGGTTGSDSNVIDYVTIATTGNAIDFGDLTVARQQVKGCSSQARGLSAGGYNGAYQNVIDYVTIATLGNATDFGDLSVAREALGACSSSHGGLSGQL